VMGIDCSVDGMLLGRRRSPRLDERLDFVALVTELCQTCTPLILYEGGPSPR